MSNSNNALRLFRALSQLVDYVFLFVVSWAFSPLLPWFLSLVDLAIAVPLIWIPIEALFISLVGTTPGKALFGIKMVDQKGNKLSYLKSIQAAVWIGSEAVRIQRSPFSFKRQIAALAVILGFVAISVFGKVFTHWWISFEKGVSKENWIEYVSQEGGFKVNFPNDPKEELKQLPIPDANRVLDYQELTTHQNKQVFYSVTYMDLPKKWKLAGANTLLKSALDIMLKQMPGTSLMNKKLTTHQNYRALDFQLVKGDEVIKGQLILVGTTLYKLTVSYPSASEQELQDDPFLDSFDLSS